MAAKKKTATESEKMSVGRVLCHSMHFRASLADALLLRPVGVVMACSHLLVFRHTDAKAGSETNSGIGTSRRESLRAVLVKWSGRRDSNSLHSFQKVLIQG